jgi:[protein-PII] uridylyltransferase
MQDIRDLRNDIEDLIIKNRPDFEISKLIKNYILDYKKSIEDIFTKTQGKDFMYQHTVFYDSIINLIYKTVLRRVFADYLPMRNNIPITFVALGSYGREQLTVFSDIDLMIAYKDIEGYNTQKIIEKFLYLAWDSGLKLGHRVHEVKELFDVAESDITIKTSLIESRMITGSTFVWNSVIFELNKIRDHNREKYITLKYQETLNRYKKFSKYSMQPNIKEGFGGLRDANFLFWVANIFYRVPSIKNLRDEVFSDEEYKKFFLAVEFLYKVRTALHIISKKKQDTVVLEHIPDLMEKLGIQKQEQLMNKLLYSMWKIHSFSMLNIRRITKSLFFQSTNISKLRENRIQKGVYLIDNELFFSDKQSFNNEFSFLMYLSSIPDLDFKNNETVFGLTDAFSTQNLNFSLQNRDTKYKNLIVDLFNRKNLYSILDLMYSIGILHEIFTPFSKVMFMPQFDGYHQHSVDIHSILSVKSLENINDNFILELFNSLDKNQKKILKMAVLFHDSGKGRTANHSEVGAKLFKSFAQELNLDNNLIITGFNLIKYHTLMTTTAYKEDIHNEKVILSFVSKINTPELLKLLYILTYSDVNSVGKDIYNSYNARLLRDLYKNANLALEHTEILNDFSKRAKKENSLVKTEEFMSLKRIKQKKLLSIKSNFFFIKYSPEEIISIFQNSQNVTKYDYKITNNGYLSIEIYRNIPINIHYLLNRISSTLSVRAFDVFQLYGDLKYFHIDFAEVVDDDFLFDIENIIHDSFKNKTYRLKAINPEILKSEIEIDCDYSTEYIKFQLNTNNQKGLLAFILEQFEKHNLNIVSSKIFTFKKRVRDMFVLEKNSDTCENLQKFINLLKK